MNPQSQPNLVACPDFGSKLRKDRLAKHRRKVHRIYPEQQLDGQVSRLYGLTPEESKIVEGAAK